MLLARLSTGSKVWEPRASTAALGPRTKAWEPKGNECWCKPWSSSVAELGFLMSKDRRVHFCFETERGLVSRRRKKEKKLPFFCLYILSRLSANAVVLLTWKVSFLTQSTNLLVVPFWTHSERDPPGNNAMLIPQCADFLPTWHKLKSLGKREPLLKNCLHHIIFSVR